jgi:hypothetical protein
MRAMAVIVGVRAVPIQRIIAAGDPRAQLGMALLDPRIDNRHRHLGASDVGPLLPDDGHTDLLQAPGIAFGNGRRRLIDTDRTVRYGDRIVVDPLDDGTARQDGQRLRGAHRWQLDSQGRDQRERMHDPAPTEDDDHLLLHPQGGAVDKAHDAPEIGRPGETRPSRKYEARHPRDDQPSVPHDLAHGPWFLLSLFR